MIREAEPIAQGFSLRRHRARPDKSSASAISPSIRRSAKRARA